MELERRWNIMTWDEFEKNDFNWDDLERLNLTWDEIEELSIEEFLKRYDTQN